MGCFSAIPALRKNWDRNAHAKFAANPHTLSRLPYDPDKDIKAVARLYYVTEGLFVTGSVPVHSVKDLQGLAASKPGYLNFGTPGAGSNLDIYREWLGGQWKTSIVGVNYKGFTSIVTAITSRARSARRRLSRHS